MSTSALISLLHESAGECDSMRRRFRGEPVLSWTVRRLAECDKLASVVVLCWEDQLESIEPIARELDVYVLAKGPRFCIPQLDAVSAARRWADGWRGGLLNTCHFDLGFYGPWALESAELTESDSVVLVDPSAGLIDPYGIDGLVEHSETNADVEICFTPAAPGLGAALLRTPLLERLANSTGHPGRLLHYSPDIPARDPLGGHGCAPVATAVARTTHRFTLDSKRQIGRVSRATVSLNGQLLRSEGEELVHRLDALQEIDSLPREVVVELNTSRATRPIYWPGSHLTLARENLSLAAAQSLFEELAAADDIRLTLAGVGDPLNSPACLDIIAAARSAGIKAIHLETDFLDIDSSRIQALVASGIDILSVHIPAVTTQIYASVMGVDRLAEVVENIKTFVKERARLGQGTPLLVPTFTKCNANLREMEAWYDQWIRAVGTAVIVGPSTFGNAIPDAGVAGMSPPRRMPCSRIASRMTILSDGRIVSCEQDVQGGQTVGKIGDAPLSEIWTKSFEPLRSAHAVIELKQFPLCQNCQEWHRS